MKEDHLKKVEARAARVRQLLLPGTVNRGEVADPQERLRELINRLGGRDEWEWPANFPLRTAVGEVVRFLETDTEEMIRSVREARAEAAQARRDLSARAGTRYTITITSDAPLAVSSREVIEPERGDETA